MHINTINFEEPSRQTILIVEDEFAVANDLRIILEKAGYLVSGIAFTIEKAMEINRLQRPDLVLLDIHLRGGQTGIDLARLLSMEDIPFVYLSANTNTSILEQAKATKPYGFLVKPFREKDVLVAIEIAHYRHAHRIEQQMRQELTLQIKLTDALSEYADWEKRLLKVARLFQPYIPFDFVIMELEYKVALKAFRSFSFLRISLEEYQTIDTESFHQMTGLTAEKYQQIRDQSQFGQAMISNGEDFEGVCRRSPLVQIIARKFQLGSNLIVPLPTAQNGDFYLSFFSRQPDTYLPEHLALLQRLHYSLKLTLDRLLAFDKIEQLIEQLREENTNLRGK